jgi:hypothetical protein
MPSDMEILSEIRQIQNDMPALKAHVKQTLKEHREACKPLKPVADRLKAAKSAVAAAKARMAELLAMGGA